MVLYFVDHVGFFLQVILHKLHFHRDEDAVLYLNEDFFKDCIPKNILKNRYMDLFKIKSIDEFPNKYNYWGNKETTS